MSARRLISTLLLLQQRGTMTAGQIAAETDVSERTARRDLEALQIAGVPLYSRAGRNGGWSLVGGARTDLTGLHADEARALFLVAGPAASASPALKSAVRKLVRALPDSFRDDAEHASTALVIDSRRWGRDERPGPTFLEATRNAVLDGHQIHIGYRDRSGNATTRTVHPWGIVDKQGAWYLVAGTVSGRRTFRIDRITTLEITDVPVERPDDFDLRREWTAASDQFTARWSGCRAELLVDPSVTPLVQALSGMALEVVGAAPDGRDEATFVGVDVEAVAGQLAGFGDGLEVVAPPEVRRRLADLGAQLIDRYRDG